jgi:hypothetical protein
MIFLLIPSIIIDGYYSRASAEPFERARPSPNANLRRVAEFTRISLLWPTVGSVQALLFAFHENASLVGLAGSFLPGVVLGLTGAANLTTVVPAGSKTAPVTGLAIGGGTARGDFMDSRRDSP